MLKSKMIPLCLAVLMVLPLFLAGCGESGANTPGNNVQTTAAADTAPVETEPEKLTTALPDKDWGGRSFRVLGRTNERAQFQNFEIDSEGITGEIISDAVYNRNAYISEKYNVTVEAKLETDPRSSLTKTVSAGDDVYDYSFQLMRDAGALASGGYLVEMSDLPYVDYTMPWWFRDINESISVMNRFYYNSSMFNLMDKNRAYIMVFNKDKAESYNIGDVYETIRDGGFTVEKMTQYCEMVSGDLDGDGAMTEKDAYGLVMDSVNVFTVIFQSQNNPIVTKDKDDRPILSVNNDHTVSSIDKMIALCSGHDYSLYCEYFQGKVEGDYWGVSGTVFREGRALFSTTFINHPSGLKNLSAKCDFNYGVIPYPKYDEAQEKYISVPDPAWATLLCIPMTNSDLEFTGYMAELLAYQTQEMVLPAYYEISAKAKYTYDEESAEMLDLIFSTLHYDLALVYNWGGFKEMLQDIGKKGANSFASDYAAKETKMLTEMEDTLAALEALE